jgi:hypothetical protein
VIDDNAKNEERLVALMKKGAKLVFLYHCMGYMDRYCWLVKVTLEIKDHRFELTTPVVYPPDAQDPISNTCPLAERIVKRSDIRLFYVGGNSDYGKTYREGFEHKDQPVPRWVSEQWDFDDNGNPIAPDQ